MKRIIIYTAMMIICLGAYSQDNHQPLNPIDEASRLLKSIESLNREIPVLEDELYSLKMYWYQNCVKYLTSESLDEDVLANIIKSTYEDIDGKALLEELKRAKDCKNSNVAYVYKEVPAPQKQESNTNNKKRNNTRQNSSKTDKQSSSPEKPIVTKPITDEGHLRHEDPASTTPAESVEKERPITVEDTPVHPEKKTEKRQESPPKKDSPKEGKKEDSGRGDIGTIKKTTKKDGTN